MSCKDMRGTSAALGFGLLLVLCAVLPSDPAFAGSRIVEIAQAKTPGFSEDERRIILDVLDAVGRNLGSEGTANSGSEKKDKKEKGAPPGKGVGAKGLPPGIAKKLARGGTLPPGIAKRDLPEDLTRRLPPALPGTERQIVDTDVLLIEKGTGLILDVIRDAVRK